MLDSQQIVVLLWIDNPIKVQFLNSILLCYATGWDTRHYDFHLSFVEAFQQILVVGRPGFNGDL